MNSERQAARPDIVCDASTGHALRIRRIGIDTYQEPVVFLREDSHMTQLCSTSMHPPVFVGVHALFCDDAYMAPIGAGVERAVTCNDRVRV